MNKVSSFISGMNDLIGRTLSWLTLLMAITMLLVILGRAFNLGSLAIQESVTYMHAMVFMLCMAYTLKEQGHVRVDVNYRRMNFLQKAWVDVIGAILFILPFSIFLIAISWQFVVESWRIREGSPNPGGIQAVFLLKTLIPLGGFLLGLQGLVELIRNVQTLLAPQDTLDQNGGV
ncbi:hypothetical protein TDB9533_03881 [Thalassocella blandensis]|nr:hypothetical protein TDB9533_03881 [Thalassocella blandensis]